MTENAPNAIDCKYRNPLEEGGWASQGCTCKVPNSVVDDRKSLVNNGDCLDCPCYSPKKLRKKKDQ